jgi:uncharacterized RDD family membrane protein YckC
MQCVRCSHQLPPRADRCLRCFALNLENAPGPLSMPLHDSGPAWPVKVRISEPAAKPVTVSFSAEIDAGDIDLRDTVTEPEREPEPRRTSLRAGPLSRLLAWSIDAALLCALLAAYLYGATLLVDTPYPLEALSSQLPLWAALAACLAVAYSWLFTALSARTPGMALAGQRLETLRGDAPGPAAALVRALLSLLSAPGMFGFLLALFDSRGQTLHDKLCGCVVVISPPDA